MRCAAPFKYGADRPFSGRNVFRFRSFEADRRISVQTQRPGIRSQIATRVSGR